MMSSSSWTILVALSLLVATSQVVHAGKPFCYYEDRSEAAEHSCHGLQDWDEVDRDEYYWDWNRFFKRSMPTNHCEWNPKGDSSSSSNHNQSPINLSNNNKNCDDDKHRQVTKHGDCKWQDLSWEIEPWGLQMTLPMPSDEDKNPERAPCTKPNFDSSGGFRDLFHMNYLMIKTPAEHTFEGKTFDGEIQMGFFRYDGQNNMNEDPNFIGPVSG
jgi:hypothetical protein